MLRDGGGRLISYLRLSVTERCDMTCRYCMPQGASIRGAGGRAELGADAIARIVRILASLGVSRVRLTGGEPLARPDLLPLVFRLSSIEGVDTLAITTNGARLAPMADELRSAGISSVNIHIDSLRPSVHRWITGGGRLQETLAGIDAARAAGFREVKLNAVLLRGVNDDEAEELIAFAASLGMPIRFIELMPMGAAAGLFERHFLSTDDLIARLSKDHTLLPLGREGGQGPARYSRIARSGAVVGFIGHRSESFCAGCNRMRLISDGTLRSCLAEGGGLPLAGRLATDDDAALAGMIREYAEQKPPGHRGFSGAACAHTPMHAIGG